ncbi:MAG: PH domain-containing protein [Nocardioides sp.]
MLNWLRRIIKPPIGEYLLREDDPAEVLVGEFDLHWVCYLEAAIEATVGLALLWVVVYGPAQLSLIALVVAIALLVRAAWQALEVSRDRLVITNRRLFRITGVINQTRANMPMARILDITVERTLLGNQLGYAHFTFETAAQEQGLREVRYVTEPRKKGGRKVERSRAGGKERLSLEDTIQRSIWRYAKGG